MTAQGSDGKVSLSLSEMLEAKRASGAEEELAPSGKRSFQPYHAQSVPKPENLEANAFVRQTSGEQVKVTTMMLRNIPNKYTQNSLLQEINDLGFTGTFDFFYLPMDVHNRSNVGYAFINFLLPADAERFRQAFSDHRFQRFQSRKISSVCTAHVQGLDENLRHFENRAVTHARNDQYRPVVIRNGVRVDIEEAVTVAKARLADKACTTSSVSMPERQVSDCSASTACSASVEVKLTNSTKQSNSMLGNSSCGKPTPKHKSLSASPSASFGSQMFEDLLGQGQYPGGTVAPPPGLVPSEAFGFDPALALMGLDSLKDGQGQDIMQLLSLRSLILDRLLQKDELAYQQAAAFFMEQQEQMQMQMQMNPTPVMAPATPWQDPAYIDLNSSSFSTKYMTFDPSQHYYGAFEEWEVPSPGPMRFC